ncbi:hypothetical protein Pta02_24800 [Planobispora takensis]|uniref:Uncharacterized protein n=1 Tax=Planobispora takensis TaxID=1367882 RepID=A0A8J3WV20_9ACTN|nr:hypothetical protein Pta02_24800 [Planobispora takensis]
MEGDDAEGEAVEGEAVEGEAVEGEAVEGEAVEGDGATGIDGASAGDDRTVLSSHCMTINPTRASNGTPTIPSMGSHLLRQCRCADRIGR